MSQESKQFFTILLLIIIASVAFGFYKVIILEDFRIFTEEGDIPEKYLEII